MTQEVQNVMREIRLEKVVLKMGLGKSGEAVEIAKKALGQISGKKVNDRPAKKAIRDWVVRKGEPIGAAVTIRGKDGKELLKKLLLRAISAFVPSKFLIVEETVAAFVIS